MFLKRHRASVSKALCLVCLLFALAYTCFLLKPDVYKIFRRTTYIEYRAMYNITGTTKTPDCYTPNEMSSFIENLPVNHEIECDKFLDKATFPENPMSYFTKPQRQRENFDYANCSNLRNQGFKLPVTSTELKHPIAFSILTYTDDIQVTRLIRAIYRPHNIYCIHIDLKSKPAFYGSIRNLSDCLPNVFVAPVRLKVRWGKYTVIEPEIRCMNILLRRNVKWKYWINLTGQEFPLKTNLELVNVLRVMNGRNEIAISNCTYGNLGTARLAECIPKNGWLKRRNNKTGPAPYGIIPYKGSVHVMLSRDFVRFMMTSNAVQAYLKWLQLGMYFPDEYLFATLIYNRHLHAPGSIDNTTIIQRNVIRLKLWGLGMNKDCLKIERTICILSLQELPTLTSSTAMFANKFFQSFSPLGYSCLERWYFQRVYKEMTSNKVDLDINYYKKVYGST